MCPYRPNGNSATDTTQSAKKGKVPAYSHGTGKRLGDSDASCGQRTADNVVRGRGCAWTLGKYVHQQGAVCLEEIRTGEAHDAL